MTSKSETTPDAAIARAIDPEAFDAAAWAAPGVDMAGVVVLTDMQEDRRAKAAARAVSVSAALRAAGYAVVPREATDAMVAACLASSLAIMRRDSVASVYPDDPPPRPGEVTRAGYRAMVEAANHG